MAVFPRVVVKNSKGWGRCSLKRSGLLHSKIRLVFLCGYFGTRQGHNTQLGANTSAVVKLTLPINAKISLCCQLLQSSKKITNFSYFPDSHSNKNFGQTCFSLLKASNRSMRDLQNKS